MSNITPDQSISGNKISGGVITNFASTGIQDLATSTSLIVTNDAITVKAANIPFLNGNVRVNGNLDVAGSVSFAENINFAKSLSIGGNLSANTLTVDKLIANVKQETTDPLTFKASSTEELNGMGLIWSSGEEVTQSYLLYKNGVLSSNMGFDLAAGIPYTIAGIPVLTSHALGDGVTLSKLTQVGTLTDLAVTGAAKLGGGVEITGASSIYGNLNVNGNAKFAGDITAGTITAQRIITPNGSDAGSNFTGNIESEVNGAGLSWTWANNNVQLIYRTGNRIWTNANIDLDVNASYKINGTPMLTAEGLGPTVTNSKLRTVGILNSLEVGGDATFGEFAFFNSTYNRFGVGIEEPRMAFGILENNVEMVFGSPDYNRSQIGTHSNHDLELVADGHPRVIIKPTGEVNIGDPITGGGALNVYGTLYATTIQTDNRITRSHPLQFNSTVETSVYGLGLVWNGEESSSHLLLMADPTRLWSSDDFEVAAGKSYYVNGSQVLSQTRLGDTVVESSLTKVGTLENLTVSGTASFNGGLSCDAITLGDAVRKLVVSGTAITSTASLSVTTGTAKTLYADERQVTIGDNTQQSRPVKVFGPLSVNVNNPDPELQFTVAGDVSIGGKRFTSNASAPTYGVWSVGDICWNSMPQPSGYIGWVCIVAGTPGQWAPFGAIGIQ
jgi:cytoskeletal protein CcmA (bactofilin family)